MAMPEKLLLQASVEQAGPAVVGARPAPSHVSRGLVRENIGSDSPSDVRRSTSPRVSEKRQVPS